MVTMAVQEKWVQPDLWACRDLTGHQESGAETEEMVLEDQLDQSVTRVKPAILVFLVKSALKEIGDTRELKEP